MESVVKDQKQQIIWSETSLKAVIKLALLYI